MLARRLFLGQVIALLAIGGLSYAGDRWKPKPGESVRVLISEQELFEGPMVPTELDYLRFCRHMEADDDEYILDMIDKGKLTLIAQGTKLKVIQYRPGYDRPAVQVRVMSGQHKGKLWWTPGECIERDVDE